MLPHLSFARRVRLQRTEWKVSILPLPSPGATMSDINIDRLSAKPAANPAGSRAALGVHPNEPATVIEPVTAVTPVGATHKTSTEENFLHTPSHGLGHIKHEGTVLRENEERRKQIDAILARLNNGQARLTNNIDISGVESQADEDLVQLQIIGERIGVSFDPTEIAEHAPYVDEGAAALERARIAHKIEAALKRVGTLKSALSSADDRAYARLLNINSSAAGLAAARVQMDASSFGMVSASSTVDTLMTNLRAAVIAAHGRMTPELMRLVFP